MHRARALNNNKQMAIAITLRGFNDLGCLVTPMFLSMGHFRYRFSTFYENNKENLGVSIFLQDATSNSIHLTSSFSCAAVSNAFLRVEVFENESNISTPQIYLYKILLG